MWLFCEQRFGVAAKFEHLLGRHPQAGVFIAALQQDPGIRLADRCGGFCRESADFLAALETIDNQNPFDSFEIDHHVPVAIAVAGDEQGG